MAPQDFNGGASETVDGSTPVTPSLTTAYTLTCVNNDYASGGNNKAVSSATVTVNGSSLCEQNPNGAGCPGQ
jgi:hypothetical protein